MKSSTLHLHRPYPSPFVRNKHLKKLHPVLALVWEPVMLFLRYITKTRVYNAELKLLIPTT